MSTPEERLKQLGLKLPSAGRAFGRYQAVQQSGNLLFLSGTLPIAPDGTILTGRIGEALSIADGQEAARLAVLVALANVKAHVGELSRVTKIVRAVGHICCSESFTEHAQVMDGASNLLGEIFGEAGSHARLSLGAATLPKAAAVELELILEVA